MKLLTGERKDSQVSMAIHSRSTNPVLLFITSQTLDELYENSLVAYYQDRVFAGKNNFDHRSHKDLKPEAWRFICLSKHICQCLLL